MANRRNFYIKKAWMALLCSMSILLTCCQEEDLTGHIMIFGEKLSGAKMIVDGTTSSWVEGDSVKINNTTKGIVFVDGKATLDNTTNTVTTPLCSIYPSTIVPEETTLTNSSTVTVQLPSTYQYEVAANGKQKLTIPLAAFSESNSLYYRHITAALAVRITNSFGGNMTLNEITIQSDNSQLCGSCTVDFDSLNTRLPNTNNVSVSDKKVTMSFSNNPLVISNNDTKDIIIPILPTDSSNHLTVTVTATYNNKLYYFGRTQNKGGAISRNEIGYVPITMNSSGDYISDYLITTTTEYRTMVSAINATSNLGTVRITIDGTLDFSGEANVDAINPKSGTSLIIRGINNATLKNLTMNVANNYYFGLINTSYTNNYLSVSDITVENITLPANSSTNLLYLGGLCSQTRAKTSINKCTVKNVIIGDGTQCNLDIVFGGLIGTVKDSVTIANCNYYQDIPLLDTSKIIIKEAPTLGGIIGLPQNDSIIIISHCSVSHSDGIHGIKWPLIFNTINPIYVGGIIGQFRPKAALSYFNNLLISDTKSIIDFHLTRSAATGYLYAGGFIGFFSDSYSYSNSLPNNTQWSGNNTSGAISHSTTGTNYVHQVVGNSNDNKNWNGLVTYNVNITTH